MYFEEYGEGGPVEFDGSSLDSWFMTRLLSFLTRIRNYEPFSDR